MATTEQIFKIDRAMRQSLNQHTAKCIWLTGLSGSGKSTLANLLEQELHNSGKRTYILDGDNVRQYLNADLGFSDEDRTENIRRIAHVARLMVDAGIIVIVAFISPFAKDRQLARSLFAKDDFLEIYIEAPLEVCEQRDTKGLYAKARANELKNFTGIDSPYEAPSSPELTLNTTQLSPSELVKKTLKHFNFNS
ncbi:adenylyl-sulfate kinase [Polynucleobacter sphagniphilus]|jgi:adenylyl-sulfate kinase|uniref:adenylyl-sulfate kinase n=1 Tax=Polynucleobacter sphagniphilus TaxID=1743169 RepID=UPI002476B73A|nr:adenylyl-sulfate kinase [Polynucleobacter sphagniphilus]MDH6300761.1 adenylylsulfate kinase [Polynucleobacter sphagniphilus]